MQPRIQVEISFYPPDVGGRLSSASSGYRPDLYITGVKNGWTIFDFVVDPDPISPGASGKATFRITCWDQVSEIVRPGTLIEFKEGENMVGRGIVKTVEHLD